MTTQNGVGGEYGTAALILPFFAPHQLNNINNLC
jgi:hypothetical protein